MLLLLLLLLLLLFENHTILPPFSNVEVNSSRSIISHEAAEDGRTENHEGWKLQIFRNSNVDDPCCVDCVSKNLRGTTENRHSKYMVQQHILCILQKLGEIYDMTIRIFLVS